VDDRGGPRPDPKPRFIRCTPLLGSDDRVGIWMIILVPVEEPVGFPGCGREDLGIGDEMDEERGGFRAAGRGRARTTSLRSTPNFDSRFDGVEGFGMKKTGLRKGRSMTPLTVGRADDDGQLYAEYLRG
jgi:hypothetical protein